MPNTLEPTETLATAANVRRLFPEAVAAEVVNVEFVERS
jgi:hypothetical protein